MNIRLALLLAAVGQVVWAQETVTVERIDMTLDVPNGFELIEGTQPYDGWNYVSRDGNAQLIFGDTYGDFVNLDERFDRDTEFVNLAPFELVDAQIDGENYSISFIDLTGRHTIRYRQQGRACDGRKVLGLVSFSYDPSSSDIYRPMVGPLLDSVTIGVCG